MRDLVKRILPDKITNDFKGHKVSLYVFTLIIIITIVRSCIHIFAPDGGAQSIAGLPLDTFSQAASSVVILAFSLWGASQLLMGIFYIIVLLKYRSLIPLMYILIFIEYSTRLLLGFYKPVVSLHTVPGGVADYIMIPLALVMLYLSLKFSNKESV